METTRRAVLAAAELERASDGRLAGQLERFARALPERRPIRKEA
jgi:hypothetical protein